MDALTAFTVKRNLSKLYKVKPFKSTFIFHSNTTYRCFIFSYVRYLFDMFFFSIDTYNIHSVNGAVGKFCLSKHYYRVGEDVLGTFDFQNSPIPCVKVRSDIQY